jgi:RNA polymerase sigma-70 factor (ECF subfamily)
MQQPSDHALEVTQLVQRERARVRRVLRACGVAERDLPDAEQEVFLVVHRKLAEFEGRSSLSTWLHRIAINVASEHRRKARHRYESFAGDLIPEPSAADPEAQLEARDGLQRVRLALEALSAEQREAFLLHEVVGLSMHEVATRLHVPLKTAFSRFYAARRGLLVALERGGVALSALWGWLTFASASRVRALAPRLGRTAFRDIAPALRGGASLRVAQLPLVSAALLCSVLPALSSSPERASVVPVSESSTAALTLAPAPAHAPVQTQIESTAEPSRSARPRTSVGPARRGVAHRAPGAVPELAAPSTLATEPMQVVALDDDSAEIIVTRTGVEDPRPQLDPPPLPAYVTPQRVSARIQLRGPRDTASAPAESLSDAHMP